MYVCVYIYIYIYIYIYTYISQYLHFPGLQAAAGQRRGLAVEAGADPGSRIISCLL